MSGPMNSPMGSTDPLNVPEPTKPEDKPENDFARLGKHENYPQITAELEKRKEMHRRSLPDSGASKLKRIEEWDKAVALIEEIEFIQRVIYNQTAKK